LLYNTNHMFWADEVAEKLKVRNLPLEHVDDMKTPSGHVHVGSLRGVVIHDLVHNALLNQEVKSVYTYVINDMDPMDGLPIYLSQEKYLPEMGKPLFMVPSPEEGFGSYAEYFAKEFIEVIEKIGSHPEIIWSSHLYKEGKMDLSIKTILDNAERVRKIYQEVSGSQKDIDWYPYSPVCPNCGKIGSTKVYFWDGKKVKFKCLPDLVDWAKGCGTVAEIEPAGLNGKLPWKLDWAAHWKAMGVTVEWAGKDHMSQGGSHQIASRISEEILNYPTPHAEIYEHFLIGGAKMSSSKGLGLTAKSSIEIIPPYLVRFLMVRVPYQRAINFDPSGWTIPDLFDEFDKSANAYWNKGDELLSRIFELSIIDKQYLTPLYLPRFRTIAGFLHLPNMNILSWCEKDKGEPLNEIEKDVLNERVQFAKIWIEKYAPDEEKFILKEEVPGEAESLNLQQKKYLEELVFVFQKEVTPEELQTILFSKAKEIGISTKDAFAAIYLSLIGKSFGPKAAWFLTNIPRDFLVKRFNEVVNGSSEITVEKFSFETIKTKDIFSVGEDVVTRYPSVSIGVAIIKGVKILKSDENLEKAKNELLNSLTDLTTEQLGLSPEVISYRKLYKETGVDWHSRRPSPEALLRRVALNKGLYTVNTCVDAYNLIVMKNRVSVGAFDADNIVFPTVLRFAKEGEEIHLLGDENPTKYKAGEIAYFDQKGGFNMDFNYRDAQRTMVTEKTTNLYINVDGVYDVTREKVERTLQETIEIIQNYCGGKVEKAGIVRQSHAAA